MVKVMKKFLILALIFVSLTASGYRKPDIYVIDAHKNGAKHNDWGLRYLNEKCYYAAIQEFKIAISLNPGTQATSTYYNNLGETYMIIGYPDWAQDCFERAITQYSLNFKYYQNLAKCLKARGLLQVKIQEYSQDGSPLNKVMLGLLYVESGDVRRGVIILDEFAMSEPDLVITVAVKAYIKELVNQINNTQAL